MPLTYTTDGLAHALQLAGSAHGVYEEALGQGRDEEWPAWYAQHMAQQQTPTPASPELSFDDTGELARSLLRAESAHAAYEVTAGHAEPEWARWYAEYFQREQNRAEASA